MDKKDVNYLVCYLTTQLLAVAAFRVIGLGNLWFQSGSFKACPKTTE